MDCSVWPEISGSEWGVRLFTPITGQRYPLTGSIDLTDRCNLRCIHCYINQAANNTEVRNLELTTAELKDLIDQMAEAGCLFLMMTGGEILIRPDFLEIYMHAVKRGMIMTLFTNGTLVNEALADQLAEYPPRTIEITLYGATQDTYEAVTGVKGSYQRCIDGIETLLSKGLNVMLKSVILKENLHELPQMRQMAEAYGLSFRYDGLLWPRLDHSIGPLALQISLEELLDLDEADPERMAEWLRIFNDQSKRFKREKFVYNCGAGFRSFHIDSSGYLNMCIMTRQPAYDLRKMRFSEAWEKLALERLSLRKLKAECETCDLGALCSQCPGWSELVHGDHETPVEFVCRLAKLRAARLAKIEYNN